MGPFIGGSITLEQIGLLGKSPGKPLGRLSLREHPKRKSPLSSGSLVTSGPTHEDLVCSGRQGAHSEPWVAQAESGPGVWLVRVGLGVASRSLLWFGWE